MKGYNALIGRVKKVNDELRDMGLEWDEVESFWNHCFRIAKERKEAEDPNAQKKLPHRLPPEQKWEHINAIRQKIINSNRSLQH